MGLFRFVSKLLRTDRGPELAPAASKAAIERLEQRVLFAVQVSTNVFDAPPPVGTVPGWQTAFYAYQGGTTNATFSMPGSSSNQVAVAYQDTSMQQYQQALHSTGWAYSSDGGQSFAQPSNDPASPALLPTISVGGVTTGDDSNQALAWDNANATLYMATTSWPNRSDINVYASTDGGRTFTSVMDATPGAPTGSSNYPNTITYDKPWLAVDNNPGPDYGTLYLAYVQFDNSPNTDTIKIFVTDFQPGGTWPQF